MEEYKLNDVLEILWIDTHSSRVGWMDEDEVEDMIETINNHIMHTVGYFIRENESYIYIVQTYDLQEARRVDGVIGITKGTIKKINVLKKVEDKSVDAKVDALIDE
jgi:hypothetical protein